MLTHRNFKANSNTSQFTLNPRSTTCHTLKYPIVSFYILSPNWLPPKRVKPEKKEYGPQSPLRTQLDEPQHSSTCSSLLTSSITYGGVLSATSRPSIPTDLHSNFTDNKSYYLPRSTSLFNGICKRMYGFNRVYYVKLLLVSYDSLRNRSNQLSPSVIPLLRRV